MTDLHAEQRRDELGPGPCRTFEAELKQLNGEEDQVHLLAHHLPTGQPFKESRL
ncbi:hypothetical protein [Streptomyces sp. NBC_00827]|uniref:hypothetical protein n=1 Tax=Streptomyces sp. NBC_00827 TaxID=2903677 RepID=UPI0038632F45|nr:hypothetical protein OG569_39580 [Streptomyces sp. NBC_00827]